jgi:hypothetical protein
MRAERTSVAQELQVVNVSGLKLLAISAARPIQYRSSRRRADQCYAAIALVQVVRSPGPETLRL